MPLGPFHYAKLKKKSLKCIKSYEEVPILTKNGPFTPHGTFFRGIIIMIFMCLLAPLNVQIFKKPLKWIQSFEAAL